MLNLVRVGLAGILLSQFLVPTQSPSNQPAIAASTQPSPAPSALPSPMAAPGTKDHAFAYLMPRTVHINAGKSVGSGSILHGNHILTCFHVIRGNEQSVNVRLGDRQTTIPATVIKTDRSRDLALLKAESPNPLPSISLAPTTPPPSTPMFVLGSPRGQQGTLTHGTLEKVLGNGDLQIQVEIRKGNSGGPAAMLQADGAYAQVGVVCGGDTKSIDPTSGAFREGYAISLDAVKSLVGGVL